MRSPSLLRLWPTLLGLLLGCSARGTVPVGGPCTIDESCTTGAGNREANQDGQRSWVGGYCSGYCSQTDCPGAACVEFADGQSYCAAVCSQASECREGYVCSTTKGACLPNCGLGWSCGTELTCNVDTGECGLTDDATSTGLATATDTSTVLVTATETSTTSSSRTDTASATSSATATSSGGRGFGPGGPS